MRDQELGDLVIQKINEYPTFSTISEGLKVFEELYKDLGRDKDLYPDDDDELTIAGAIFRDIAGTTYEEFRKILWVDIVAPIGVDYSYSIDERMRVVSLRDEEKENTKIFAEAIAIERENLTFSARDAIQQLKNTIKEKSKRVCYYAIFVNKNPERESFIRGHQWYKSGKIAVISKVRENSDEWYIHHTDLSASVSILDQSGFGRTIDILKEYNRKLSFYLAIDYSDKKSEDESKVQLWTAFTSVCDLATISLLEYFRDEIQNFYLKPILSKYGLTSTEDFLDDLQKLNHQSYSKSGDGDRKSIEEYFKKFITSENRFVTSKNKTELLDFLINKDGLNLSYEYIIQSLRTLALHDSFGSISTIFIIIIILSVGGKDKIDLDSCSNIRRNRAIFAENNIIEQSKERLVETILSMKKMFSMLFYDDESGELSIKRVEVSKEGSISILLNINPVDKNRKRNLFSTVNNIFEEEIFRFQSTPKKDRRDNHTSSRSIIDFWLRSSLCQTPKYEFSSDFFKSTFNLIGCIDSDDKDVTIIRIGEGTSTEKGIANIRSISRSVQNIIVVDSQIDRRDKLLEIIENAISESIILGNVVFCHLTNKEYLNNRNISENSHTVIWYTGDSPKEKEQDLKEFGFEKPFIIQQKLSPEDVKQLSKQDIEELLTYVMTPQDLRGRKPKLLRNNLEFLPALSILCQGYLAVYADSDDNYVKEALDKMNWDSLTLDISNKKEIVKQREWWLKIFDKSIEDIIEEIKKEWNEEVSNDVYGLLENLKTITIDEPSIVAKAYIAIAERLDKE